MKILRIKVIFISIVVLLLSYIFALFIVKQQLRKALLNIPELTYTSLEIDYLGKLTLTQVFYISPKLSLQAETIRVKPNYSSLIFSAKTELSYLAVNTATVEVFSPKLKPNTQDSIAKPELAISQLKIENTNLIYNLSDQTKIRAQNIDLQLNNNNFKEDFQLGYLDYVKCDTITYPVSFLQILQLSELVYKNKGLQLKSLKVLPLFSPETYSKKLSKETDLFQLESYGINTNIDQLKFKNKRLTILNLASLQIDSLELKVYRDKLIEDDTLLKSSYLDQLKALPFQFVMERFLLKNGQIYYAEKHKINQSYSAVVLNDINLELQHLNNQGSINSQKNEAILVSNFKLNQSSKIKVNIDYDLASKTEKFQAKVVATNIEATTFSDLLKQSIDTKIDGKLNSLTTVFQSENNEANGDFNLIASKLKVSLFTKSGKERKFVSALANKLLSDSVDTSFKLTEIKKDQTKSFWNFIWSFLKLGLKQSLLKS